jgi:hypothetical protein
LFFLDQETNRSCIHRFLVGVARSDDLHHGFWRTIFAVTPLINSLSEIVKKFFAILAGVKPFSLGHI